MALNPVLVVLFWIAVVCTDCKSVMQSCKSLKYSELEKLGASCSPMDTCAKPRTPELDNLSASRCQCGKSCVKSNTCCIDSPSVHSMPSHWNKEKKGTCRDLNFSNLTIIVVSTCQPEWNGDAEVKSMCENPDTDRWVLKDPIGQAPVTNAQREITYLNYFCALCNNDTDHLQIWNLEISKLFHSGKIDNENFLKQLRKDEHGSWVVDEQNDKGETVPEQVTIEFAVPPSVSNMIYPCVKDLVSECAEGWEDYSVQSMCHAYMGIVYLNLQNLPFGPQIPYRNIHCAICNNVSYSPDNVCHRFVPYSTKPPFSFTLLLDVNLSDGDKVGDVNRCGSGKMYDPFFKKCRTLACGLPGHVIKEDKCVKV